MLKFEKLLYVVSPCARSGYRKWTSEKWKKLDSVVRSNWWYKIALCSIPSIMLVQWIWRCRGVVLLLMLVHHRIRIFSSIRRSFCIQLDITFFVAYSLITVLEFGLRIFWVCSVPFGCVLCYMCMRVMVVCLFPHIHTHTHTSTQYAFIYNIKGWHAIECGSPRACTRE